MTPAAGFGSIRRSFPQPRCPMTDHDPYPPPDLLEYVSGVSDPDASRAIGAMHRETFVRAGLRPTDNVLEVGCGTGRVAIALVPVLGGGSFDGFDISRRAIDWCRDNITPRHPTFRFAHADVYNEFYNPGGRCRARRFRFPYPAAAFDFVYLTSVFTHMLPRDLSHYLAEVSRVLRPGGRCVVTFFLHTAETAACVREGRSTFRLPYRYGRSPRPVGADPQYGDCFTESPSEVERVVAYERRWVLDQFAASGLTVDTELPGSWSGRSGPGFQDVVTATKTGRVSLRLRLAPLLRLDAAREWVWKARMGANRIRRRVRV